MFVVVTVAVTSSGSDDFFGDIILITEDQKQANIVACMVEERRPYPGLDYTRLAPFNKCIYFDRDVGKVLQNREDKCSSKAA